MVLLLRIGIILENYDVDQFLRPPGPLFHRWLPDGRTDAVAVPMKDVRNRLELWFARRGYDDSGFVRWDNQRSEVNVGAMSRQAKLDAGYLFGEATYAHTTDLEIKALQDDRVGSDDYIGLAKRIIDFLYPPIAAFVDLLRTQYGQYWLRELRQWDSRTQSLGSYCSSTLGLHWRQSVDEPWHRFQPNESMQVAVGEFLPGRGYAEYLTEADWRHIQATFDPGQELTISLKLVARAHGLRDRGHLEEAFVQATTALELAVEHFVESRCGSPSAEPSLSGPFLSLPLKTKLFVLGNAMRTIPSVTLDNALKAIDMRNRVVHEGEKVRDPDWILFLALIECVRVFAGVSELKTPVLCSSNALLAPDLTISVGIKPNPS